MDEVLWPLPKRVCGVAWLLGTVAPNKLPDDEVAVLGELSPDWEAIAIAEIVENRLSVGLVMYQVSAVVCQVEIAKEGMIRNYLAAWMRSHLSGISASLFAE